MATRYKINWRTIFRNLPRLIILTALLKEQWPSVRARIRALTKEDPELNSFITMLNDAIEGIIVKRKKR